MLMTKGLDSKILYSLLIVSGFVLTIGAASAVVIYSENIELDNGAADSSIKITSSTGDSKLILEDQGNPAWSVKTTNVKNKFEIKNDNLGKSSLVITKVGKVGIGTPFPKVMLDVIGDIHTYRDADVDGNLNVDGSITGSYIAALEATIAALEARIASESGGGGGPNPCDPNGDSEITAQEIWDYMDSQGIFDFINNVQNNIDSAELDSGSTQVNGVLDNITEVTQFNTDYMIGVTGIACTYP